MLTEDRVNEALRVVKSTVNNFAGGSTFYSDRDDAIQDCMLRILKVADRYDESRSKWASFVSLHAKFALKDRLRDLTCVRKKYKPPPMHSFNRWLESDDFRPELGKIAALGIDEILPDEFLQYWLRGFSELEIEVFYLYHIVEFTMKEVGELLGYSESRISQIHNSLIKRVREIWQERKLQGELDA